MICPEKVTYGSDVTLEQVAEEVTKARHYSTDGIYRFTGIPIVIVYERKQNSKWRHAV